MRRSRIRIKIPDAEADAVYHCISRTVNGERILDDIAKEILRRQIWQIADFCGVIVLTYAIMDNHFHVLVKIPKKSAVSDAELLRRYRVLYPKPTSHQTADISDIESQLKTDGTSAAAWRKRQLALMGDISVFMKFLKQRFSIWFNKTHARFGTLWAERFKSVLVDPSSRIVRIMAAYIDLNPIRAGIVSDPKNYRFCGYGEAVAGGKNAQTGITHAIANPQPGAPPSWKTIHADYRRTVIGAGAAPRTNKAAITEKLLEETTRENGRLPVATVLRCRIRYFTDGAVLGGQVFVAQQLTRYRRLTGRRRRATPRPLPPLCDWSDAEPANTAPLKNAHEFTSLRALRKRIFG
jgi:REP element-mobilizing transposase RayT